MRSDLPLGFLAAQVTHAAGESITDKLPPHTHAVVLAVPDESTLRDYSARLSAAGVSHVLVIESDAPYEGQATAIGVMPLRERAVVRRVLSSLPLLK